MYVVELDQQPCILLLFAYFQREEYVVYTKLV